jgi:hypothetical protein
LWISECGLRNVFTLKGLNFLYPFRLKGVLGNFSIWTMR